MEFRVLGPVEALADGERLHLGGAKPRLLLAALLAEPGRVVPADRLIDIIWGDEPPDTARALIHTYVSTLRRALNQPGNAEVIATQPPGYLIRVEPGQVDRVVFDARVEAARAAAREGQLAEAIATYRDANALWRGSAFGGIGDSLLAAEAARLNELRLAAISERIEAELALGRSDHLVVELTALVGNHPTHERLRGHLMVVLYRLGRQADALASYREGRDTLVDQLGIEPGPQLRAVHDAILRGSAELLAAASADRQAAVRPSKPAPLSPDKPAEAAPPATSKSTTSKSTTSKATKATGTVAAVPGARPRPLPAGTVAAVRGAWPRPLPAGPLATPAQLPSSPADFTGRTAEVASLVAALTPRFATATPTCVIAGKGGAGKTTLAVQVAHELAPLFPDGQLYAELRGTTDAPVQPGEVLGRFLRALGADAATLPESLEERVERFRTLLAGRRVLVVLDDAENERQVRPLLPGGPGCAVLVTARRRLPGLDAAMLTELDMLEPDEAAALLASIAGPERVRAEPEAAARIAALCGCLPLAVRIVGARLASRRHWSLGQMAGRLGDEARRLDELSVSDQQVRAGIEVAYRSMPVEAQQALRHLGALNLPDFPGWIVAGLLDVSVDAGEEVVEQLVDAQLIDFVRTDGGGQPRFRLHELVRLYAHERGLGDDAPEVRAAAVRRVVACWLWLIDQISQSAPTGSIPLGPPLTDLPEPDPAIVKPILASPRAWLDAEQPGMVIGVERAAAMDLTDVSVALATALCGSVFAVGNLFEAWSRTHDAALAAARRAGDRAAEATLLAQLGQLRCDQDRYPESHEYLVEALGIFREVGDARGEATVLAALGTTCREQGHLRESMHFLRQAQVWFRTAAAEGETTVDPAIGYVGRLTGATRLEQGDLTGAVEDLRESVAAYRRVACQRGEALSLRTLSLAHRANGDLVEAAELSAQALSIFVSIGDELLAAYGLQAVAKTQIRLGHADEVLGPLSGALATCRRLGDRWGEAFMLRTRGELHLAAARLDEADADLTESIACWEALDVPLFRARSERDLASVREAQGDAAAAAALRLRALDVFRAYGAREFAELSSGFTDDLQATA